MNIQTRVKEEDEFLAEVEAFLKRSGVSATALGQSAIGDRNLVFHMRNRHRALSYSTVVRVRNFIAEWDRSAARAKKKGKAVAGRKNKAA